MRRLPTVLLATAAAAALASCAPDDDSAGVPKTVIFFGHASATLDAPAQKAIATVARRANRQPTANVTVAGYAAANGDIDADEQLAAERTRVVAALLQQDGVVANRIQSIPRPPTNEFSPPIAARRVEITVGAGS